MEPKKKILIVDDEVSFCDATGALLKTQGYDVQSVHTGREGIEAVQSQKPDLILLDVHLPEEDGLSVLRRLKRPRDPETGESSTTREIPVIVVTGQAEKMEDTFLMEEASGFLVKPMDRAALTAAIGKIFERK